MNKEFMSLDEKTPSTFTKDKDSFKCYFNKNKHNQIDNLDYKNIKNWIK